MLHRSIDRTFFQKVQEGNPVEAMQQLLTSNFGFLLLPPAMTSSKKRLLLQTTYGRMAYEIKKHQEETWPRKKLSKPSVAVCPHRVNDKRLKRGVSANLFAVV
jgi:hypothetical protein